MEQKVGEFELNKIYCMDCLEGLKKIPDNSIDLILTDPPYGIKKEGVFNDDNLEQYYNSLPQLYRVLKDDRFFITYASIGRLPEFFKNNPFEYRWQYIIYIDNGMVRGSIGFSKFMLVLIFQKGKAKINKPIPDLVRYSTSSQECAKRQHPTQKDVKTLRRFIEIFSKDGIVLDPFAGSGSTLIASKELNKNFIGFEISQEYCDIANKRLQQEVLNV